MVKAVLTKLRKRLRTFWGETWGLLRFFLGATAVLIVVILLLKVCQVVSHFFQHDSNGADAIEFERQLAVVFVSGYLVFFWFRFTKSFCESIHKEWSNRRVRVGKEHFLLIGWDAIEEVVKYTCLVAFMAASSLALYWLVMTTDCYSSEFNKCIEAFYWIMGREHGCLAVVMLLIRAYRFTIK